MSKSHHMQRDGDNNALVNEAEQAAINYVYYYTSIDAQMRISIEVGEDIDWIRKRIKLNDRPDFDSIPVSRIQLCVSIAEKGATPLRPFDVTWNREVTWGTMGNPLIVKVIPFEIPTTTNRSGKRYVHLCLYVVRFT